MSPPVGLKMRPKSVLLVFLRVVLNGLLQRVGGCPIFPQLHHVKNILLEYKQHLSQIVEIVNSEKRFPVQ